MSEPKDQGPGFHVPIPDEIVGWGNAVAEGLSGVLPPGWGMGLLIFKYSEEPGAPMFWISTASRTDMAKALQEWVAREGGS